MGILVSLSLCYWSYPGTNGACFEDVVEGFKHQLGVGHPGIEGAFYDSMLRKSEASGGMGWAPDLPLPKLKPRGKTFAQSCVAN